MTGHPDDRWTVGRLAWLLSPLVLTAVAINLFMLGLITRYFGWFVIPPVTALLLSVPLAVPASWLTGRWVRGLMDQARD